ncbi:MAG: PEP-CTERM sorting domain-containing protein [Planctomycetota bacterium]
MSRILHFALSVTVVTALTAAQASAVTLYTEDFDDGNAASRWDVTTGGGPSDVDFAFDYSTIGLASPTGDPDTIGVWFNPNIGTDPANDSGGADSGIVATPDALDVTGDYRLTFYYASSFDPGDGGSTEGPAFGINATPGGATAAPIGNDGNATDGVGYHFSVDQFGGGGFASVGKFIGGTQERLYDNYGLDDPDDGAADLDPANFPLGWDFDGPPQDIWQEIAISQLGGVVTFRVNGTVLDSFDNSAGDTAGAIFLGAVDSFGSVGDHYHIFDDVVVETIPEPTSVTLVGLGLIGLVARRKRG